MTKEKLIVRGKQAMATAALSLVSVAVFAQEGEGGSALPADVTAAFTTVGGYAAALFAASLALWVSIRGSLTIFRLANKFLTRAGG